MKTNKVKRALTMEEAKLKPYFQNHGEGVYSWKNEKGYQSLAIGGVDVLRGKKAVDCWRNQNGFYKWKDKNGYYHLAIDGVNLLEGKKAVDCWYRGGGVCCWKNKKGFYGLAINGVDVLEGKKAIDCNCFFISDAYEWKDEQGEWHIEELSINN
jgi:hypothetical protein